MQSPEFLTLSTGHEVQLPLETEARMDALLVGVDAAGACNMLPDGLAPIRLWPGRAAVTLVAADYDRIGDDAMAPYDEFGVFVAATPRGADARANGLFSAPELRALRHGVGGYTVALPVTTEPACALGVEGWGYPKTVADISIRTTGGNRRATIADDRGHLLTMEPPTGPRVPFSATSASFTDSDPGPGGVRRQPLELSGRIGSRPLGGRLSLGDHPLAERLHDLKPGRPLLSVSFAGTFRIHQNERLPP